MLPGEPDAAEHLDAVLGVVDGRVQGQGRGGRGRQRMLVRCLVGRAGRVPGHRRGALGAAQHPGAQVLDRLERADRPAELAADAGVAGGGGTAVPGHASGLGTGQGGRQVADGRRAQPGQDVTGGHDRAGEPHAGQRPGEVHRPAGREVDIGVPGREQEPRLAVAGARAEQQVRGGTAAQYRARFAAYPQRPVREPRPGDRALGQGDGHRGLAGGQGGEQFLRRREVRVAAQHQPGQQRRQDRPGRQRHGELLQRGGQIGHRAARPARHAKVRQGGPVPGPRRLRWRRAPLGAGFQSADQRQRAGLLRPVADRCLQGPLFRGDRDGHWSSRAAASSRIRTRYICHRPARAPRRRGGRSRPAAAIGAAPLTGPRLIVWP